MLPFRIDSDSERLKPQVFRSHFGTHFFTKSPFYGLLFFFWSGEEQHQNQLLVGVQDVFCFCLLIV